MLACGTPDAVDEVPAGQANGQASPGRSWRQKLGSGRSSVRPWRRTIGQASKRILANRPAPQKGESSTLPTLFTVQGGELLTSTGTLSDGGRNPTDLPSNEEAEAGDSEVDSSITQAKVTEPPRKKVYARVLERRILADRLTLGFRRNNAVFVPWSWEHWIPALYPPQGGYRAGWEVCPTSPHVLCGSGEGILTVSLVVFCGECSVRFLGVCSQGPEGVRFGNHRISSLLFVDDVVLLASSSQDLQHVLEWFAAECEAAGMRISTSKSEAMVLDRKRVACPLRVGGEILPQVEEFKYLGVLFTSE
ncbi:hypothetical protein L3Q82_000681 [Scortum barcoo]|uniref:Uncharacterized protein n=1 Tax=Scortum barcoo TaxID=214431 RepID=A0ACB8WG28_9TELE|nr:hypothetical protein L3Q82_000681 [Scortum barcoo]